jgi:hypothetical protein
MQVLDNETFIIYLSNIEFYFGFTLLHSVPVGRMIALDLYAEVKSLCINSDQLYGAPYIWQVPFLNIKKQYYFASFFIIEPTQYFLQVHASQFRCRF